VPSEHSHLVLPDQTTNKRVKTHEIKLFRTGGEYVETSLYAWRSFAQGRNSYSGTHPRNKKNVHFQNKEQLVEKNNLFPKLLQCFSSRAIRLPPCQDEATVPCATRAMAAKVEALSSDKFSQVNRKAAVPAGTRPLAAKDSSRPSHYPQSPLPAGTRPLAARLDNAERRTKRAK